MSWTRHHDSWLRSSSILSDSADRHHGIERSNSFFSPPAITSTYIKVSRSLPIPCQIRVGRCQRLPEYGPAILFFSGGSAIRELSRVLKRYTHNSVHLITPFDSGGSSAEIRRAFDMLSVGDLRNRLLALSDESALGNPEVTDLFSHRLDREHSHVAKQELEKLLTGRHPLAYSVSMPMRSILLSHLRWFASRMPPDFDLKGASVGNLIITGCFLEHDRDIVTAIFLIWTLLGAKGNVRPLTGSNLHIRTYYEDGTEEVGQHKMGKNKEGEKSKIIKMDLVKHLSPPTFERQDPLKCDIDDVSAELISSADLITFPMGSFFSSVLVNLLPQGVGKAITQRNCPKVYVPNTGDDPEMYGYSLIECASLIIDMVRKDAGEVAISEILQFILVDTKNCYYCIPIEREEIANLGITLIDVQLVDDEDVVESDPSPLAYQCNNSELLEDEIYSNNNSNKSHFLSPKKVLEVLLTLGS